MVIQLKNICKRFSETFQIKDLNLEISDGSFTTLLGPSGCGKTTILRMIAGLERPDHGEIYFDDRCVFSDIKKINIIPEQRRLGFVFQDFALWPHMTVYENVAFPLRATKQVKDLDRRVKEALSTVRLDGFEKRYPKQLSGGQQQRVAFARAIVAKPKCILFDEPLSALDAILREEMRAEMMHIVKELHSTAVFVTHDQLEAMSMSDHIVVMNKGKIEQIDNPENIYRCPNTSFVARFVGKSNWIDKEKMIRPEALHFQKMPNDIEYRSKVISTQFIGNAYELCLEVEGRLWSLVTSKRLMPNDELSLFVNKDEIVSFT